jgi:large subunit ribosomal protein L21
MVASIERDGYPHVVQRSNPLSPADWTACIVWAGAKPPRSVLLLHLAGTLSACFCVRDNPIRVTTERHAMTDPENSTTAEPEAATPEPVEAAEAPVEAAAPEPVTAQRAPVAAAPQGYAIIETGGKQYRVKVGDRISVERLPTEAGNDIVFDRVLLLGGEGATKVGTPVVTGASVTASVDDHFRGEKIVVFKYKPKKRYRRRIGHRQELTHLTITGIAG